MTLLSGLGDILVAIVVGVPSSFVLEVFFVIVGAVILPGGWLGFCHFRGVFSQPVIDQGLFLHCVDVHVVDWRQLGFFFHRSRQSAPVGLNSFHVPLVDNCYYIFVAFNVVDFIENSFVPLVDQDALLLGADFAEQSNEEVDSASIDGFGEGLSSPHVEGIDEIVVLGTPAAGQSECFEVALPEESVGVEIWLVFKGFDGDGVKGDSSVYFWDVVFAGVLAGKVGFESGVEEVKIFREL